MRTTAQIALAERLRPDHADFWPNARVDLTAAHLIDLDFRDTVVGDFRANGAVFGGDNRFSAASLGQYS